MRRTMMVATMVVALTVSTVATAIASHFSFGDEEDWRDVRGGVSAGAGDWNFVDDMIEFEVNETSYPGDTGDRSTGIIHDFDESVEAVSVDVYLDQAWDDDNVAVSARLLVTEEASEEGSRSWPALEFTRMEGLEGFRIWGSAGDPSGWLTAYTLEDLGVSYGEWVTLSVVANSNDDHFSYAINGTPVGGTSPFAGAGTIGDAMLMTETFTEVDVDANTYRGAGDFTVDDYNILWRGLDTDRLFDNSGSIAEDDITIDVDYDPELDVSIAIEGETELSIHDFGDYEVTVTNHGIALDEDLEDWNLGLEVSSLTNLNELTLEFCADDDYADCVDVNDLDDVELMLVDDVVQVVGSDEATLAPGFSETFYFRAAFRNTGQFTGNVYVLQLDD